MQLASYTPLYQGDLSSGWPTCPDSRVLCFLTVSDFTSSNLCIQWLSIAVLTLCWLLFSVSDYWWRFTLLVPKHRHLRAAWISGCVAVPAETALEPALPLPQFLTLDGFSQSYALHCFVNLYCRVTRNGVSQSASFRAKPASLLPEVCQAEGSTCRGVAGSQTSVRWCRSSIYWSKISWETRNARPWPIDGQWCAFLFLLFEAWMSFWFAR